MRPRTLNREVLADTISCWLEYAHLQSRARFQTLQRLPAGDDVLYIAWAFPPDVSGGVYRPLSVANHFASVGQQVTVVAREPAERRSAAGDALWQRVDARVRVHRLPDGRRRTPSHRAFPRVDSSLPAAMELARECLRLYGDRKPRLVLATGPPFHDFVAGYWLSKIWKVPLIVDYRDEWTECPFAFVRVGPHDAIWERRINAAAAAVVFVSQMQMEHHLRVFGPALAEKAWLIPNGWDQATVPEPIPSVRAIERVLIITFAGTIGSHTPVDGFLTAFAQLLAERQEAGVSSLRLQIIGRRDRAAREALASFPFQELLDVRDEMPQPDAIAAMQASDLLLIINTTSLSRYIPGKLYDYLASGTPVLSYGQGGEIERILAHTQAGVAVRENHPAALREAITGLLARGTHHATSSEWLAQHTRAAAADQLMRVVRQLTADA